MFDCCMINDELDLLEIRLNILYPFVEKFVIVESNRTHSGKPKRMHFLENKDRFEKFMPKIINLQYNGFEASKSYEVWGNEWTQRDTILEALNIAKPTDGLLFVSDVDEIPRPEKLFEARCIACSTGMPVAFNMAYSMYYMNLVSNTPFRGAFLYNPDNAKEIQDSFKNGVYGPTTFRWQVSDKGRNDFPSIDDSGWHFSTLGGIDAIKNKLDSYAHIEFNTPEINSEEHLLKCIEDGVPYFEKLFKFDKKVLRFERRDISFLPEYIQNNTNKYWRYILKESMARV